MCQWHTGLVDDDVDRVRNMNEESHGNLQQQGRLQLAVDRWIPSMFAVNPREQRREQQGAQRPH
jgi:hypothetical protein